MIFDKTILSYVRTDNYKNIILLIGDRESFRNRQRNKMLNNEKNNSLKFVSYKTMIRETTKNNKNMYGPFNFHTLARM